MLGSGKRREAPLDAVASVLASIFVVQMVLLIGIVLGWSASALILAA